MPLKCGKQNVSRNIRELMHTGKYAHKQCVAIALSHARQCKGKPKRGFKKCVLTMLAKTRVRKNLCLYKCLNEAIKTCK